MERQCLMLDLIDDPALMARYRHWHADGNVPDAVLVAAVAADIRRMEIYQLGDRLVMFMETGPDFDPAHKAAADAVNPDVQAWEAAMEEFKKPTPWTPPGRKWAPAERIFAWTAVDAPTLTD